jgi:hypothetical protein
MTVLGACPGNGNLFANLSPVTMNEVSTIAAAYAMAGFATDVTHVSSSGTPLAQIGVANAFANAGNLVSLATGSALSITPSGNGTVPISTTIRLRIFWRPVSKRAVPPHRVVPLFSQVRHPVLQM